MWVSKKQWDRMEKWIGAVEDRLTDVSFRESNYNLTLTQSAESMKKELNDLRQRVKELETQVAPQTSEPYGGIFYLASNGPMVLRPSTKPVTLLQKVNLLFDYLKLRVQPEGTTPATIVKTGAKK